MNSNQTNNIAMDAKAKAQELINRFKQNQILAISNTKGNMVYPYISAVIGNKVIDHQAKQYALIVVDEILNLEELIDWDFWSDVKQEIENL